MDLCFLDLETTGFEPSEDSIIEVSFVRFKDGKKVAEYDQVMRPDKSPLNPFVSHLTGIDQAEIDDTGKAFVDEAADIQKLIGGSVIVGHNIDFDIRFLVGNGIEIADNPRLDTHELARILLPLEPSFALEVLSEKYGFAHASAHRAMSDVLASKDLFELLLEKITDLPTGYLEAVRSTLENKTDWYAKTLFLDATSTQVSTFYQKENFYTAPQAANEKLSEPLDYEVPRLLPLGSSTTGAQTLMAMAQDLIAQGKQVLLLSPKLDFFNEVPMFPTPEVLYAPERMIEFINKQAKLDDLTTTFYLQCELRHHLGFRGVFFFDLFFKMRQLWQSVHQLELPAELLAEKAQKPLLALSPEAWYRFGETPELADRVLLIDESEMVAERLLRAPTQAFSFAPFLDRDDEASTAAQFLIHHFCREVIEPKLEHQIGPFGAKELLHHGDDLSHFADNLSAFLSGNELSQWQQWLSPTDDIRWVEYFPESGRLSWHAWQESDWTALKARLHRQTKGLAYRTPNLAKTPLFWRVWFGLEETSDVPMFKPDSIPKLIIPEDLVSHNSPDFNQYCSAKIASFYQKTDQNLAVNFTSLDTMRHCFEDLTERFVTDENFAIYGEKISGGDAKLWQLVMKNQDKKQILCTQKMCHPRLASFETDTLVMQKFPFPAPSPLLSHWESYFKQNGQSWWDLWVVPQMTANLARRVANFPHLKQVVWLDPRENSRWGKALLKQLFS